MENSEIVTESNSRYPKFGLPAGIGAILVYLTASLPVTVFLIFQIQIDNENLNSSELSELLKEKFENPNVLIAIMLINCAALFTWAFLVSKLRGSGNPFKDFGIRFTKSSIWFFFLGIALQFAFIITMIPIQLLKDEGATSQQIVNDYKNSAGASKIIMLLIIAFLVPFTEELCFRGIFLRGLAKRAKPVVAILICGILFGAIHLADTSAVYGLVALIGVGLISSALTIYRGRIDASIALHIGFNFTTALILLFI